MKMINYKRLAEIDAEIDKLKGLIKIAKEATFISLLINTNFSLEYRNITSNTYPKEYAFERLTHIEKEIDQYRDTFTDNVVRESVYHIANNNIQELLKEKQSLLHPQWWEFWNK